MNAGLFLVVFLVVFLIGIVFLRNIKVNSVIWL